MAGEVSQLANAARALQGTAGQFKSAAENSNGNVAKVLKDVGNIFSSQKRDLADLVSNVQSSIQSNETVGRKIETTNSLIQQSMNIQQQMLQQLFYITKEMKNSNTGGKKESGGIGSAIGGMAGKAVGGVGGAVLGGLAAGGVGLGAYGAYKMQTRQAAPIMGPGGAAGGNVDYNKQHVLKALNDAGITDNATRAAIAAQVQGESGFKPQTEKSYENTSVENIRKSFGSNKALANKSDEHIEQLKKDPKQFFNSVYGAEGKGKELGNTEEDDGYKYRGRGFIQLTGKSNYAKYSKIALGDEKILLENPDLANDPEVAAKILAAYNKDRLPNAKGNDAFSKVQSAMGNANPHTAGTKQAAFQQFQQSGEFNAGQQPNAAILATGGASAAGGQNKGGDPSQEGGPTGGAATASLGGAGVQGNQPAGSNGRLDPGSLVSIGGNHKLQPAAAQAYKAMVAAAKAEGIEWGVTDSYRTYDAQVDVARRKGLYSQGGLAAQPGRSNHGWGTAVDLGGGAEKKGSKQNQWLNENAQRFGFSTIPRETWHWEYKGGGAGGAPNPGRNDQSAGPQFGYNRASSRAPGGQGMGGEPMSPMGQMAMAGGMLGGGRGALIGGGIGLLGSLLGGLGGAPQPTEQPGEPVAPPPRGQQERTQINADATRKEVEARTPANNNDNNRQPEQQASATGQNPQQGQDQDYNPANDKKIIKDSTSWASALAHSGMYPQMNQHV